MTGSPLREPEESGTASPAHEAAGGESPGGLVTYIESVDADGTLVSTRRVWGSDATRHPLRAALKSARESARETLPQAVAGLDLRVVMQFEAPHGPPSQVRLPARRAVRRLVRRLERAAAGREPVKTVRSGWSGWRSLRAARATPHGRTSRTRGGR